MSNQSSLRDCMTIAHLLANQPLGRGADWPNAARQAAAGVMWLDLLGRLKDLPADDQKHVLGALSGAANLGDREKTQAVLDAPPSPEAIPSPQQRVKRKVDVLIICPLAIEMNASLVAFGINPWQRESENFEGHKIFHLSVKREDGPDVSVAITAVTKPRQVSCAITTLQLISTFDPYAVFLSGIGGGVKGEVELADVVISSRVIDVSGGRAEADRVKLRDEPISPPRVISRQANYFGVGRIGTKMWSEECQSKTSVLRNSERFLLPSEELVANRTPKIGSGIILAGEQLVADGSLPFQLDLRDDRIRSCDMEGSGFAQACAERDRQWLIFRGISDYGDEEKDKVWQAIAALNAALAVNAFLRTEFRLPTEMGSFTF